MLKYWVDGEMWSFFYDLLDSLSEIDCREYLENREEAWQNIYFGYPPVWTD